MNERLPRIVIIYDAPTKSPDADSAVMNRLRLYLASAEVLSVSERAMTYVRYATLDRWINRLTNNKPSIVRTVVIRTKEKSPDVVSTWLDRGRVALLIRDGRLAYTIMAWDTLCAHLGQTVPGVPMAGVPGLHDVQPFPEPTGKHDGVSIAGPWGIPRNDPIFPNALRVYRLEYRPGWGMYRGVCTGGRLSGSTGRNVKLRDQYWEEHDIDLMLSLNWIGPAREVRSAVAHKRQEELKAEADRKEATRAELVTNGTIAIGQHGWHAEEIAEIARAVAGSKTKVKIAYLNDEQREKLRPVFEAMARDGDVFEELRHALCPSSALFTGEIHIHYNEVEAAGFRAWWEHKRRRFLDDGVELSMSDMAKGRNVVTDGDRNMLVIKYGFEPNLSSYVDWNAVIELAQRRGRRIHRNPAIGGYSAEGDGTICYIMTCPYKLYEPKPLYSDFRDDQLKVIRAAFESIDSAAKKSHEGLLRAIRSNPLLGVGYAQGGYTTAPGEDHYARMASRIFGVPYDKVSREQRAEAKSRHFRTSIAMPHAQFRPSDPATYSHSTLKPDEIPVVLSAGEEATRIADTGEFDNQTYYRVIRDSHTNGHVVQRLTWNLSYNRLTGWYAAADAFEQNKIVHLSEYNIRRMIDTGKLESTMASSTPYPDLDQFNAAIQKFPRKLRATAFAIVLRDHGKVDVNKHGTMDVMSSRRKKVMDELKAQLRYDLPGAPVHVPGHLTKYNVSPPKGLRFISTVYDEAQFEEVELNKEIFPANVTDGEVEVHGTTYNVIADVPQIVFDAIAGLNVRAPWRERSNVDHLRLIRASQIDRARMGYEKYGVTMDRQDLTLAQLDQHAFEEALDLIVYLRARRAAARRLRTDPSLPWQDECWVEPLMNEAQHLLEGLARQVLRTNPSAPLMSKFGYINPEQPGVYKATTPFKK